MFNETKWHPEEGLYRAVTGSNSNFPTGANGVPSTVSFPTKGTIPIAKTNTGTLSTTGINVRGVGTLFLSEFKPGDWLYNSSAATIQSVRKIRSITSDTVMQLEQAFGVDVSGIAVLKCEPQTFKAIQSESTGTAAAILQEAPFAIGSRIISGGSPIAYDASASNAQISFTCHK